MTKNRYPTDSDGPEVQPSLILEFLIKRFNEGLKSNNPKVPFLVQGLGLVGLGTDEELLSNYRGLLASPHLPPREIVRRAIEIFQLALARVPDGRSAEDLREQTEDYHEPDEKASRQIMMNALREGKIMIEQADYRFVRVFEVLGWMSLQRDQDWLAEFETVQVSFKNDPEEILRRGTDILKDALFRHTPRDRVHTLRRGGETQCQS